MNEIVLKIIELLRSGKSNKEIKEALADYHESDIASVVPYLEKDEQTKLFSLLDKEVLAEVLTYIDDIKEILDTIPEEKAADLIELMDADDAVDVLQELDEEKANDIIELMDEEAKEDAKLILSYDDDQIGSIMTTNFVTIKKGSTVRMAMKSLISQASDNDNISTLMVINNDETLYGGLDLKDLIRARENEDLEDYIQINYPSVSAEEKIDDCINDLKDYAEDIIPVLDEDNKIIGVITASDITEAIQQAAAEDYSKLAGLTSEEDLNESIAKSMKKRVPWLLLLLVLGTVISLLISSFGAVIAAFPVLVFFQSLILDMAGNTGTQSLAVTIRVLTDEELSPKKILKLFFKEVRVGFFNGLTLGAVSFLVVLAYLCISKTPIEPGIGFNMEDTLIAAAIVSSSLFFAMLLASMIGTIIPIFFKKIKVDPAVASGPLITTINDIVAVCCYYGFAYLMFSAYL